MPQMWEIAAAWKRRVSNTRTNERILKRSAIRKQNSSMEKKDK